MYDLNVNVSPLEHRLELSPLFFGDVWNWFKKKVIKPIGRWFGGLSRDDWGRIATTIVSILSRFLG